MLRRTLWIALLVAGLVDAGGCCCCCRPCGPICGCSHGCDVPDDYRGGGSYYADCGCGELYIDDWKSSPPRCEPCDQCAHWTGPGVPPPMCCLPPRAGSVMPVHGLPDGSMYDEPISGDEMSSTGRTNSPVAANSSNRH